MQIVSALFNLYFINKPSQLEGITSNSEPNLTKKRLVGFTINKQEIFPVENDILPGLNDHKITLQAKIKMANCQEIRVFLVDKTPTGSLCRGCKNR